MRTLLLLLALLVAPVATAQTAPDTVRTGRGCVGAACVAPPRAAPVRTDRPRYTSPAPWPRAERQPASRTERYVINGAVLGGGLAFVATMALVGDRNDSAMGLANFSAALVGSLVGAGIGALTGLSASQ